MIRIIISILSVIVLLSGIVLSVSPIPIGAILIFVSLSVLVYVNPSVQNMIKRLRQNYRPINEKIYWLENKIGDKVKFLSQSLIKTRPGYLDQDSQD